MTITTNPSRDEYTSSPGQTVFNYTFKIYESTDLNVYVTPGGQEANDATDIVTNYTVDSNTISNDAGGFITFDSPLNDGDLVTIVSDIPTDRTTDYQANGDFIPQTVNNDFDRTVSLVKQVENLATRTIQFQESQQSATGITLPAPSPGDILQWNDAGDGFENTDGSGILGIDQAVADAESARDAAQQSEANAANSETDSSDSALLSQAWAESATEPGDPGTKSSKTWAGESAASAQEAADEVASIDKVYLKSGRKNYIINGNFDIWQRGTSFIGVPGGSFYLCDRFNISLSGSGISANFQRNDFAVGQMEVPNNPAFYLRCALTTGTYTAVSLNQPIEDVRNLAGEEVAYSFWAKANQAENVTVALGQDFGTGGSPTVTTVLDIKAITTGWQKFEGTVTLPSISGKTIGAGSFLGLVFVLPNVTGFIFDIAQVQLEKGSYATEFEYRSIGEELALCQRYYNVFGDPSPILVRIYGSGSGSTYQFRFPFSFPAMRVSPTVVNTITGEINTVGGTSAFNTDNEGSGEFVIRPSGTGSSRYDIKFTLDAEL